MTPALPEDRGTSRLSRSAGPLFLSVVCAIGFTFDLSEISFGTAVSGVFSAPPYSLRPGQLSWLLASLYIGAILGPPIMGSFADRNGRRSALAATLFFLAAMSFASVACQGVVALTLLRGLSGIALGAYPPLMITYLTDVLPAQLRGRLIMLTVAIAYLGPPATIFLMRWLTALAPFGLAGWRWVIGIDGIGALLAAILFLQLPESANWRAASLRSLPRVLRSRRKAGLVTTLAFLAPWATVAFPLLTAAFLVRRGLSLSDTLLYVGVSTFGPFLGAVLVAPLADRFTRRTALVVCAAGMAGAAVGFYVSDQPLWLTLTSFAFNLSVALYMPALTTYIAELFPTRARGRATSWAWSANRLAAATVPLIMLPLLHERGEAPVFSIIVATLIATVVLLFACGPAGKAGLAVN